VGVNNKKNKRLPKKNAGNLTTKRKGKTKNYRKKGRHDILLDGKAPCTKDMETSSNRGKNDLPKRSPFHKKKSGVTAFRTAWFMVCNGIT